MVRIFDIKMREQNTFKDALSVMGKKCTLQLYDKTIMCIIKKIVIDTNVWVHVYDIDTRREIVALLEEIALERCEG